MPTSRRQLIATVAAIPAALTVTAAPAAAADSLPALVAERERLNAIYEAADREEIEAWDVLAHEGLCTSGPRIPAGWFCGRDGVPERRWFFHEENIRAYYASPKHPRFGSDDEIERMIAKRCRELADARETWERRKVEMGLPAIEARVEAAGKALCEIEQRIENTPARTLADAVALVRYASKTIDEDSYGYVALENALAALERLA